MVNINDVREHMDVIDANGETIGRVDSVTGKRIKLTRKDSPDGQHHYVDATDIARVDAHVHLTRTRNDIYGAAAGLGAASAATSAGSTYTSPRGDHGDRKTNWLPWLLGGAALLALLAALSQCQDQGSEVVTADPVVAPATTAAAAGAYTAGTTAYEVDRYLAGTEIAPRTFQFQNLNFDSGAATIRDADQSDLNEIARVLSAYPQVRAAVIGYTDAEGPAASNVELGAQRARAVVAALGERGIAAGRLETRTAGEGGAEASNASDAGRAANRRTELVILSR